MTEPASPGPSADTWVASVHAGERDSDPLGSAVVVDRRRLLTCAHMVLGGGAVRTPLWVCFAKLNIAGDDWRMVAQADWVYEPPAQDLAVLLLDRDVPDGVEAAPLRCPPPGELVGRRWWAYGFPDPLGDSADGLVGAALARGWVRLDASSRYQLQAGFSGGACGRLITVPLWVWWVR